VLLQGSDIIELSPQSKRHRGGRMKWDAASQWGGSTSGRYPRVGGQKEEAACPPEVCDDSCAGNVDGTGVGGRRFQGGTLTRT